MPEAPLAALSSPAARSKYVEYARAIALRPTQAGDLYSDLGSALSALGERRAAAAAYMSAIAVAPAHAVAYNNLAALLRSSPAHRGEALRLWLTAHALQPQQYARYPEMHLNVAGVLVDAGRYDEAIWHYERGLRYTAHEGDTLGRLLHLYQRTCDWRALDRLWPRAHHLLLERELPALECSRSGGVSTARRLGVRPALSPMHALTLPLMACELHGLAVAHAAQAEAEVLARNLSFAPHHGAVDWRRPLRVAAGGERRVDPNGGDAGGTMGVARSARGAGADDARTARRRPHAALHVGFLSSDWKRHPVAILMAPTLDAMRSECAQLRISAFALNPVALPRQDTDGMGDGAMTTQSHQGADGRDDGPPKAHAANASRSLRAAFTDDASSRGGGVAPASTDADWEQRVRRAVDTMVPLHGLSDMDAARRVHEARINVLIDLNGLYSRGARPVVLATRPAPLQSTHLGYGASSGARFVDWAIADPIVMPPLTAHGATLRERIVLLPPSHLPSGHAELYPHMIVRAGGAACCARWCEEAGSGGASAGGGRASVGGGGASAGCEVSGRGHTGSRREGGGAVASGAWCASGCAVARRRRRAPSCMPTLDSMSSSMRAHSACGSRCCCARPARCCGCCAGRHPSIGCGRRRPRSAFRRRVWSSPSACRKGVTCARLHWPVWRSTHRVTHRVRRASMCCGAACRCWRWPAAFVVFVGAARATRRAAPRRRRAAACRPSSSATPSPWSPPWPSRRCRCTLALGTSSWVSASPSREEADRCNSCV